ncbi:MULTISPECIES: hypothetical protein [unclassified Streptomyces]|uniref:Uncharacterized protein n=1 Tax=Streptomyces sp. NBC_00180 TaxID=2903632 RepID=A0AAU1I6N9_9ACTN|nr:hypothetical protein OG331_43310 [Streptomyces sp. NBC_01017]
MDMEVRERVKALCGQLSRWPSVRETVREGAAEGALDELLTLLRGREEPDPARLEELLDTIGRAAAERGLPGLTSRVRGPIPALPHGMPAGPETLGWTCPLARCTRVVLAGESEGTPVCAAADPGANAMTPYAPRPGTR